MLAIALTAWAPHTYSVTATPMLAAQTLCRCCAAEDHEIICVRTSQTCSRSRGRRRAHTAQRPPRAVTLTQSRRSAGRRLRRGRRPSRRSGEVLGCTRQEISVLARSSGLLEGLSCEAFSQRMMSLGVSRHVLVGQHDRCLHLAMVMFYLLLWYTTKRKCLELLPPGSQADVQQRGDHAGAGARGGRRCRADARRRIRLASSPKYCIRPGFAANAADTI